MPPESKLQRSLRKSVIHDVEIDDYQSFISEKAAAARPTSSQL